MPQHQDQPIAPNMINEPIDVTMPQPIEQQNIEAQQPQNIEAQPVEEPQPVEQPQNIEMQQNQAVQANLLDDDIEMQFIQPAIQSMDQPGQQRTSENVTSHIANAQSAVSPQIIPPQIDSVAGPMVQPQAGISKTVHFNSFTRVENKKEKSIQLNISISDQDQPRARSTPAFDRAVRGLGRNRHRPQRRVIVSPKKSSSLSQFSDFNAFSACRTNTHTGSYRIFGTTHGRTCMTFLYFLVLNCILIECFEFSWEKKHFDRNSPSLASIKTNALQWFFFLFTF